MRGERREGIGQGGGKVGRVMRQAPALSHHAQPQHLAEERNLQICSLEVLS